VFRACGDHERYVFEPLRFVRASQLVGDRLRARLDADALKEPRGDARHRDAGEQAQFALAFVLGLDMELRDDEPSALRRQFDPDPPFAVEHVHREVVSPVGIDVVLYPLLVVPAPRRSPPDDLGFPSFLHHG
jgi:hypothetical protein